MTFVRPLADGGVHAGSTLVSTDLVGIEEHGDGAGPDTVDELVETFDTMQADIRVLSEALARQPEHRSEAQHVVALMGRLVDLMESLPERVAAALSSSVRDCIIEHGGESARGQATRRQSDEPTDSPGSERWAGEPVPAPLLGSAEPKAKVGDGAGQPGRLLGQRMRRWGRSSGMTRG